MKHLRLLILCLFAVFAVSAAASSSALAVEEECKFEEGNLFVVCILNTTSLLLILQTSSVLFAVLQEPEEPHLLTIHFTNPVTVECSEATGETTAEPILLFMKTKLHFTSCKASEAGCAVLSEAGEEGNILTLLLDGVPSLAEE